MEQGALEFSSKKEEESKSATTMNNFKNNKSFKLTHKRINANGLNADENSSQSFETPLCAFNSNPLE